MLATFTSPGPLVFQLGPFALRWYGLLIAVAVLLGLSLATRLGRARGIEPSLIADLLPLMVLGAVIGARIYYVALEWRQYSGNWLEAIAIWRGGIASTVPCWAAPWPRCCSAACAGSPSGSCLMC